jgi:hypothetical protein
MEESCHKWNSCIKALASSVFKWGTIPRSSGHRRRAHLAERMRKFKKNTFQISLGDKKNLHTRKKLKKAFCLLNRILKRLMKFDIYLPKIVVPRRCWLLLQEHSTVWRAVPINHFRVFEGDVSHTKVLQKELLKV